MPLCVLGHACVCTVSLRCVLVTVFAEWGNTPACSSSKRKRSLRGRPARGGSRSERRGHCRLSERPACARHFVHWVWHDALMDGHGAHVTHRSVKRHPRCVCCLAGVHTRIRTLRNLVTISRFRSLLATSSISCGTVCLSCTSPAGHAPAGNVVGAVAAGRVHSSSLGCLEGQRGDCPCTARGRRKA
jgi:hypothetical protein